MTTPTKQNILKENIKEGVWYKIKYDRYFLGIKLKPYECNRRIRYVDFGNKVLRCYDGWENIPFDNIINIEILK